MYKYIHIIYLYARGARGDIVSSPVGRDFKPCGWQPYIHWITHLFWRRPANTQHTASIVLVLLLLVLSLVWLLLLPLLLLLLLLLLLSTTTITIILLVLLSLLLLLLRATRKLLPSYSQRTPKLLSVHFQVTPMLLHLSNLADALQQYDGNRFANHKFIQQAGAIDWGGGSGFSFFLEPCPTSLILCDRHVSNCCCRFAHAGLPRRWWKRRPPTSNFSHFLSWGHFPACARASGNVWKTSLVASGPSANVCVALKRRQKRRRRQQSQSQMQSSCRTLTCEWLSALTATLSVFCSSVPAAR